MANGPWKTEAYGVFEGGGVKGTALVGALKAAEERGIIFRAVAGTSAGSIVASLHAAGYSADELYKILIEKDFKDFIKKPVIQAQFWKQLGIYKTDNFRNWIQEKLKEKLNRKEIRFDNFPMPLKVVATELTYGNIEVFDAGKHPRLSIADAVRASMSIPFFFVPYRMNDDLYVDGGVMANFPAYVFREEQKKTGLPIIGFRLSGSPMQENVINHVLDLGLALYDTIGRVANEQLNQGIANLHAISLPTLNVKTTDFAITRDMKQNLYNAGHYAAHKELQDCGF
jgi:NTE family protein